MCQIIHQTGGEGPPSSNKTVRKYVHSQFVHIVQDNSPDGPVKSLMLSLDNLLDKVLSIKKKQHRDQTGITLAYY
jgi:hypothetical protein